MKAYWSRYTLDFRFTAITSRESLNHKITYFLCICDDDSSPECGGGIGEAALFRGLSYDDRPDYESMLTKVCGEIDTYAENPSLLADYPSIRFALETALLDYRNGSRKIIFDTPWSRGESSIIINGLIWMGDASTMRKRVSEKLAQGFNCIKVKIGGINFDDELRLLATLRSEAPDVILRLDANGAFSPSEALEKLKRLSEFSVHSIEQPVRPSELQSLEHLCRNSPIPIALDEQLLGLNTLEAKRDMISYIRPQYLVIKPSLCGGFQASTEWIELADRYGCGWWITSALESDIGLNAIAQFTSTFNPVLPQGLGTGQLYSNNISSPLTLNSENLSYNPSLRWNLPPLKWN